MSRWRRRLDDAGRSFAVNAANRNLRRAQLSFAAAWTGEWMLTVALSVVAFRDGGPTAVGDVAFLRMVPAAVLSPVGTALADRFRRDRVLRWTCAARAGALAGVRGDGRRRRAGRRSPTRSRRSRRSPSSCSGRLTRRCCRRCASRRWSSRAPTSCAAWSTR